MTAATDLCKDRIEQFLRRDLAGWEGLPAGCVEQDIARWAPLLDGEGIARFGSDVVEYRFRVVEAADFIEPVRLNFRDSVLCLVRTGLWSTDPTERGRLLRDLGEPPDRLDLRFGMGTIANAEWVYAARGLTLGVIPESDLLASVAVYPPCSVATYRRRLYHSGPAREFPGSHER